MQPHGLSVGTGEISGTVPAACTAQAPLELWLNPRAVITTVAAVTTGGSVLEADRGCAEEAGGAVLHGGPAAAQVEQHIGPLTCLPGATSTKRDPQSGH